MCHVRCHSTVKRPYPILILNLLPLLFLRAKKRKRLPRELRRVQSLSHLSQGLPHDPRSRTRCRGISGRLHGGGRDYDGDAAVTVATSYTELIGGIQARIASLGIRQLDFDKLAGFPEGLTGKAFGPAQVKRLGPEKLFDALRAAGLKLRIEEDPEQLLRMQKQIAENCQVRVGYNVRTANRASPVSSALLGRCFKHLSRLGNKKKWGRMSKEKRSEHGRMMGIASGKKRRKLMKQRARQRAAAHKARKSTA